MFLTHAWKPDFWNLVLWVIVVINKHAIPCHVVFFFFFFFFFCYVNFFSSFVVSCNPWEKPNFMRCMHPGTAIKVPGRCDVQHYCDSFPTPTAWGCAPPLYRHLRPSGYWPWVQMCWCAFQEGREKLSCWGMDMSRSSSSSSSSRCFLFSEFFFPFFFWGVYFYI